jgi:uncharacterized protein
MDRVWRAIGEQTSRRTWTVLAVAAVLTAVLSVGLTRLDFATGQDSYLAGDDPAAVTNERYQETFGGEAMVGLLTMRDGRSVADLFTPANVASFEALEEELRGAEETFSVISPLTALQWNHDMATSGVALGILGRATARETDAAAVAARGRDDGLTLLRAAAAGEPALSNPAWISFLIFGNDGFEVTGDGQLVPPGDDELVIRESLRAFFPDRGHALFVAFLGGNASLDELADGDDVVSAALAKLDLDHADVLVTGTPTFLTDLNDYLQGGMLTLGLIAAAVMLVVLGLTFRVRWRLLPLAVVAVGIVWTFGIFGFTGRDLSLVTIAGLPILIGIGIDFAIQIHNRVEEEAALDREPAPFAEVARRLGPPMAAVTVAAVIAFMSMQLSLVPMIRDFGLLLAIGIVVLLVAGTLLPLALLGSRERRRPTTSVAPSRIDGVVTRLGSLPAGFVVPFAVLAVVLPVVGLALEQEATIESDPINWADQSSSSVRNARVLESETGFATTLGLFVETGSPDGAFSDTVAAFTHDVTLGELERQPRLAAASSLVTTLSYLLAVPGATALAPTAEDLRAAYEVAPPDIQRSLVSPDGSAAQVTFWVAPSSLEERAVLVEEIESAVAAVPSGRAALPDGVTATPAGLARVGVGLLENLTANRLALALTALWGVSLWLLVRLRSVARAVLAFVPVLIAVGASTTVVSLLDITLSPLTTVGVPLVVATCAEFSVLILSRYLEERERGLVPREASRVASMRSGRAFVASALTTVGGFGVLVFAALPLLSDFGAIVTLNVTIALLAALVIVPPTAVWADGHGLLRPVGRRARAVEAAPGTHGAGRSLGRPRSARYT